MYYALLLLSGISIFPFWSELTLLSSSLNSNELAATSVFSDQNIPNKAKSEETIRIGIPQGQKAGDRWSFQADQIEYVFRWCPPGSFLMGSPETEEGRYENEILHEVGLSKGFWILETEVTQKMFQSVMKQNPSRFQNPQNPVECVSWEMCNSFAKSLTQLLTQTLSLASGEEFALPTEAQWEYACRAGTQTSFAGELEEMAWFNEDSDSGSTHEVALKKPNPWGIYDMHGNVWEWCADGFRDFNDQKEIDPKGPDSPTLSVRIDRGGCWDSSSDYCRSAHRGVYEPKRQSPFVGFRIILIPGNN
ncbi:MAG: formylglycine-generating enzyme family protein [Planctomycetia bacterium]|nr:formylglycine-generating enzyme family protein [Planctomycetia bacterium]